MRYTPRRDDGSWGRWLRGEREKRQWSLRYAGHYLGVTAESLRRWEAPKGILPTAAKQADIERRLGRSPIAEPLALPSPDWTLDEVVASIRQTTDELHMGLAKQIKQLQRVLVAAKQLAAPPALKETA